MATASPVSSTLSDRGGSLDTASSKLQQRPSPRKLKRLQSASTDEQHSDSKCKLCGWHYPIQTPNSRQRRHHKKICPKRPSLGTSEDAIERLAGQGGPGRSELEGSIQTAIERSAGHGGPEQSESGGSIQTGDYELSQATESREMLSSGKMETEKVKEREEAQNETEKGIAGKVEQGPSKLPEKGGDDKLEQGSSKVANYSRHEGSGIGEEKVASLKQTELGSQHISREEPRAEHSPRDQSDEEIGSDSGVWSAAAEHETDPDGDMGFDGSDIAEAAKREDSFPSNEEMLDEEKKYGALQHKHLHTLLKEDSESSHWPIAEGEGKTVNVADLITIYEKGKGKSASVPADVTTDNLGLASSSYTEVGESGQLSSRRKDHRHRGGIIPAEDFEGSTALRADDDLEAILRKQKTHNLICPVCGSEITNRIIVRKKRRIFVSKNVSAQEANLTELSSEVSDHDPIGNAVTSTGRGTWLERCFGYFNLFRR